MKSIPEKLAEAVKEKLGCFGWICSHCPKILECQELPAKTGFEPRYCWTIIEAAILNKNSFEQPF